MISILHLGRDVYRCSLFPSRFHCGKFRNFMRRIISVDASIRATPRHLFNDSGTPCGLCRGVTMNLLSHKLCVCVYIFVCISVLQKDHDILGRQLSCSLSPTRWMRLLNVAAEEGTSLPGAFKPSRSFPFNGQGWRWTEGETARIEAPQSG